MLSSWKFIEPRLYLICRIIINFTLSQHVEQLPNFDKKHKLILFFESFILYVFHSSKIANDKVNVC